MIIKPTPDLLGSLIAQPDIREPQQTQLFSNPHLNHMKSKTLIKRAIALAFSPVA